MKASKNWALRYALCVAAVLMVVTAFSGSAAAQSPTAYNVTLGLANQTQDSQGRTVITMVAAGDLPGVLTLVLSTSPDGTVTGGEWALNVSYTSPLNPNAQPDPTYPDPDAAIGEQFIQLGVLKGVVTTGSATLANGSVTALAAAQLSVTGGTVRFASVSSGAGTVVGSNTADPINSTGSMILTF